MTRVVTSKYLVRFRSRDCGEIWYRTASYVIRVLEAGFRQ